MKELRVTKEAGKQKKYKSVLDSSVDDALREKAKKEIHETEENVRIGMQKMNEFIAKENLPFQDNEVVKMMFLRARKFRFQESVELAKATLKANRMVRKTYGEVDPDVIRRLLEKNIINVLPYRDAEGRVIAVVRSGTWVHEDFTAKDVIIGCIILAFYAQMQPATQIAGICVIFDTMHSSFKEFSLGLEHTRMALPLLKAFAVRIHRVDMVNVPYVVRLSLRILGCLIPKKIMSRLHIHGYNTEALLKHYDPDLLPDEFGGNFGPMDNSFALGQIEKIVEEFRSLSDLVADISL